MCLLVTGIYRTDYHGSWWKDAVWVRREPIKFGCRSASEGGSRNPPPPHTHTHTRFLTLLDWAFLNVVLDFSENN